MLCLTYLYIVVILIITILVVFFLPLFLVILRVLGITRRLPQPDIKPETGKVEKNEVDKVTKLVYYVDEDEWLRVVRSSRQERSSLEQLMPFSASTSELTFAARINTQVASMVALPTTPALPPAVEEKEPVWLVYALPGTTVSNSTEKIDADTSAAPDAEAAAPSSRTRPGAARPHRSRARLGQMLSFGRQNRRTRAGGAAADKTAAPSSAATASSPAARTKAAEASAGAGAGAGAGSDVDVLPVDKAAPVIDADRRLKYPLHPLPSHRSTCPICLCDFESPLQAQELQEQKGSDLTKVATPKSEAEAEAELKDDAEPEPLRLLPCQHVLHASCIDQWLTTVSGRCPICQRPVLKAGEDEEGGDVGAGEGAGRVGEGGGGVPNRLGEQH